MLKVFALILLAMAVTGHENHSFNKHRSLGGSDWQSSGSPVAGRSFGALGRANKGWGSYSGLGSNTLSSYSSNGHTNSFSARSNYPSDNFHYANSDTSIPSAW